MADFKKTTFLMFFPRLGIIVLLVLGLAPGLFSQTAVKSDEPVRSSAQYQWEFMAGTKRISNIIRFSESIRDGGQDKGAQVTINANVKNAEISLGTHDGRNGYLYLDKVDEGSYFLRVESEGYEDFFTTLTLRNGRTYNIDVELAPIEGYLSVSANLVIQELLINNINETGRNLIPLREGEYDVRVRSFGYQEFRSTIQIKKDQHLRILATLVPADFSARLLGPTRNRFRPENPGDLGTTTIKFEVQAPGSGIVTLFDAENRLVNSSVLSTFGTWNQGYLWDGRDKNGARLPDGTYRYLLELQPAEGVGGKIQNFEGKVAIDSTSFLRYQSLVSGVSGTFQGSETYTLPEGAYQIGFGLSYRPTGDPTGSQPYPGFHVGARFSPYEDLEFGAAVKARVSQINQGNLDLGLNLFGKYALLPVGSGPFSFALALSGGFLLTDDRTRALGYLEAEGPRPGVFLHFPLHLSLGVLGILLEPIAGFSPWPDLPYSDAQGANENWGFEGTTNFALEADLNEIQLFLGTRFRTSYVSFSGKASDANQANDFYYPAFPFKSFLEIRFTLGDGFGLDASVSADSYPGKYAFSNWLVRFEAGLVQ